jgi:hypothetical protein
MAARVSATMAAELGIADNVLLVTMERHLRDFLADLTAPKMESGN